MKFYLACRWHKCHFCELSFVQAPKCLLYKCIIQSKFVTKKANLLHNLACTSQFWKQCMRNVNKFDLSFKDIYSVCFFSSFPPLSNSNLLFFEFLKTKTKTNLSAHFKAPNEFWDRSSTCCIY